MTSMTSPSFRQLASFTVRSEPGNERLALTQVAEAVAGQGLSPARLERLKTAVAETAMNAIEHGNRNQPELPVDVEVTEAGGDIVVTITDQGGAPEAGRPGRGTRSRRQAHRGAEPAGLGAVPHPPHGGRDGRDDRGNAAHGPAHHAGRRPRRRWRSGRGRRGSWRRRSA